MTESGMTENWQALFERGATFDVDREAIATALATRREDDDA
ncbi:hypothetical protein [Natronosalvus vescus]|nr:hypothetical protein [Natronosalvus vescus]